MTQEAEEMEYDQLYYPLSYHELYSASSVQKQGNSSEEGKEPSFSPCICKISVPFALHSNSSLQAKTSFSLLYTHLKGSNIEIPLDVIGLVYAKQL